MSLPNLSGSNISSTFNRLLTVDSTGSIYDGTGSRQPITFDGNDVHVSGTLHAQSYVVSESVTTVTSGSTVFGNSDDDIHQLTGSLSITGSITSNITASGNISASGNIVADYYDATTSGIGYKLDGVKVVYIDSTKYHFGRQGAGTVISGSTIELGKESTTHITASGNISASGTGSFSHIVVEDKPTGINIQGTSSHATYASQTYVNNLESGDTETYIPFITNPGAGYRTLHEDSELKYNTDANILTVPNISSSGMISGSIISGSNIVKDFTNGGTNNVVRLTLQDGTNKDVTVTSVANATSADCADKIKTVNTETAAEYYLAFVDSNNSEATCEDLHTTGFLRVNPGERYLVVEGGIKTKGSDVTIHSGSISMSGDLIITGSISGSQTSTGSFAHIITSTGSIEFRHNGTKKGELSFTANDELTIKGTNIPTARLKASDIGVSTGSTNIRLMHGSITASGDISGSRIQGLRYDMQGKTFATYDAISNRTFVANTLVDTTLEGKNIHMSASHVSFSGHIYASGSGNGGGTITASGDISSSGNLIGTLQNKGDGTSTGNITFDSAKGVHFVDSSQTIVGSTNAITIESDDYLIVNSDVNSKFNTPLVHATGDVSASDVSASGNISGSTITAQTKFVGTELEGSSITLDSAADITLDAAGDQI